MNPPPSSDLRQRQPGVNGKPATEPRGAHVWNPQGPPRRHVPFHSRKGRDYRLRGLDFGLQPQEAVLPRTRPRLPRHRRRRLRILKWFLALALIAVVALAVRSSAVEPFAVPSSAMVPTLQLGDRILVAKSSFLAGPIAQGDIVVFRPPASLACDTRSGGTADLVKRVIGMPGQTIWSIGNSVYVQGAPGQQTWGDPWFSKVAPRFGESGWNPKSGQVASTPIASTEIPPGSYYVMSDNRVDSCDSRSFGVVPKSLIVGKVVAVLFRNGHPYLHFF